MSAQQRRHIGIDATNRRPEIAEQPSANGRGHAMADLYDAETLQQRHATPPIDAFIICLDAKSFHARAC